MEGYATLLPQDSYGSTGLITIIIGFLLAMYFFMYDVWTMQLPNHLQDQGSVDQCGVVARAAGFDFLQHRVVHACAERRHVLLKGGTVMWCTNDEIVEFGFGGRQTCCVIIRTLWNFPGIMQGARQQLQVRPQDLEFNEFRVGRLYSQILQIAGRLQGKLLVGCSPGCRDVLEVEFVERVDDIVRYRVVFTPQLNEDSKGTISVMHKGSMGELIETLVVQVRLKRRKAVFSCLSPLIEFGEVILNERSCKQILFRVEGVDSPQLEFQTSAGVSLKSQKLSEAEICMLNQLKFAHQGKMQVIDGQIALPISYLPTFPSTLEFHLQARLKGCLETKPQKFTLVGSCVSLPIVPENSLTSMNICIVGHCYKQKLLFLNRSSNSSKVQLIQPLETRRIFQFSPLVGFINKHSQLEVQATLKVEKDVHTQLAKYLVPEQSGVGSSQQHFEIPFRMTATAQQSPVQFRITFSVTSDRLTITPSNIDFGRVYSGTASKCEITLHNQSVLEQEVLFLQNSKHITVNTQQPIKLLPEERKLVRLLYRNFRRTNDSLQPTLDESHLKCRVVTGGIAASELKLNYTCMRMYPSLLLSHNKIELPAIQIDEMYSTRLTLTNQSDLPIVFEVFLPFFQLCGLQITPIVKVLAAKESLELSLQYWSFFKTFKQGLLKSLEDKYAQINPGTRDLGHQENRKRHRKASSHAEEVPSLASELSRLGGRYTKLPEGEHYEWLIPIYFKQKDLPDASAEVTYLEVSTVSVEKTLLLDRKTIDFGDVPVGYSQIRHLYLTNMDPPTDITKSDLHSFSGFEVINSLKRIDQNEQCVLVIRFHPIEEISFEQKLILYSERSMVSCVLRGNGVRPEVAVEPTSGLIEMGELLSGQSSLRTMRIHNNSNFDTKFRLKQLSQGTRCTNGLSPFSIVPTEGRVAANQTEEVAITFSPSSPGKDYFTLLDVDVEEQRTKRVVRIQGNCHRSAVYLYEWKQQPTATEAKRVGLDLFDDLTKIIVLEVGDANERPIKKLVLGCCMADNPAENVRRSWKVNFQRSCELVVTCQPSEGELLPGQQVLICIQVARSPQPVSIVIFTLNEASLEILRGIGQWEEVKVAIEVATQTNDQNNLAEARCLLLKAYVPLA